MIFFRKHPCRLCLVAPACQETCKEINNYTSKCVRLVNFWEKISRIFCGLLGGCSWMIARSIFNFEEYNLSAQIILWLGVVLAIALNTNIIFIFIFKYIRKRLFLLSEKRLHRFTLETIFPEYYRDF